MAKITITLEDVDGQVGMLLDREGKPFDPNSQAHQMANAVLNFLDRMQAAYAPAATPEVGKAKQSVSCLHKHTTPIAVDGAGNYLRCNDCGAKGRRDDAKKTMAHPFGELVFEQPAHAPQMVRTAQEINAIKAATLVHQSEPIIIHGG